MKFPRPDGVSLTNGIICVGYEDNDERDLAFDWLGAYGNGEEIFLEPFKPLVWNEYVREGDLDELEAGTPFGTYYTIKFSVTGYHVQHDYSPLIGIFEGLESAKAAAQQDYEKRLRSAYDV